MTEYVSVAPDDRAEARSGVIKLHGPEGFAGMRAAGRLAASILDALVPHVVPGVTSAIGAPALAGIPVTHRGIAAAFYVVSGHDEDAFAASIARLEPGGVTLVVDPSL